MDKPRILSGELIVAKGITKIDATLPELGLKDVSPNGSWLEQKQIQAALEARKHLIEVERIEKFGTLSHAEWREDVQLAEVSQKAGSYWQYFGHNVGKRLFLKPEEALFLIELNCLQLTHNDVTVSLQKAYSLLLHESISIIQYKVYASLSRLGYKVFRHKYVVTPKPSDCISPEIKESNESEGTMEVNDDEPLKNSSSSTEDKVEKDVQGADERKMECEDHITSQPLFDSGVFSMEEDADKTENCENTVISTDVVRNKNINDQDSITASKIKCSESENATTHDIDIVDSQKQPCYINKLEKLRHRKLKPTDSKALHKHFESIPDLYQKQVITINVPDQEYLPKNVFVNKSSYMLTLETIRIKSVRPVSTESPSYSITDEVNGDHVRRIRSTSHTESPQNMNPFPNARYPRQPFHFRPFNFWRPQQNLNYYQFGMFFQRPFYQNMYFIPRFQMRPHPNQRPFPNFHNVNFNRTNTRKRSMNLKTSQLQGIKELAARFKHLIMSGNTQIQNIQALHRLLHTYNMKYKTRLRLTENFDVTNDETIIETIELEDDEESRSKRPRLDDHDNMFKDNLNRLRQLALKLKELESNNKATARQRRAFSSAIKTLNKSYNSDVYLNSNYEIIDRRHITLDSSSESDCVVEQPQKSSKKKKKLLRNPFNLLKRLSEKMDTSSVPTTSEDQNHNNEVPQKEIKYNEHITRIFNKNWLPSEDDFGRAEVAPKLATETHFTDGCEEEFIIDFINDQPKEYNSWLEAKISFLKHIENANIAFQQNQLQNDVQEVSYTGLRPLIGTDDRLDMPSVLEKLRIIKNNKEMYTETSLRIDFDVYNRDVQNFRKTNPPKPHFRVICLDESTSFPSAADVATLHSKYDDNVAIVFAVVGASVAYLQINPTDLPIYIPNNDIV